MSSHEQPLMTPRMQPLWQVQVQHAFRGALPADELAYLVPAATRQRLAGLRAAVREREGQLNVLLEMTEADEPVAGTARWLASEPLLFGLVPRAAGFAHYTDLPRASPDEVPLWENFPNPRALATPRAVRWADLPDAAEWLPLRERPVGLLRLRADESHLQAAQRFTLPLAARQDTLRYYVVGRPFPSAEFDTLQVVDEGAAAESRARLSFHRVLPAAFTSEHLAASLLDASGQARVALFEADAPTPRRERGPGGLRLRVNDNDILLRELPTPDALRADAQFVVHITKV